MITIAELLVDKLPARADVATRVLTVVDDPTSNASDLARAVGADPALAARTLGLANSAYYGLSGRVATIEFAVSVIGFNTVRALSLTLAAGLDRPGAVPEGFWEQAATSAAAAGELAPAFGVSAPEAFCLGLLHTMGSALLHQVLPLPALCLPFPADSALLAEQEIERYGYGHAEVGAQVLAGWNFPPAFCALIADHHDALPPDASPMARVLQATRSCADMILREDVDGSHSGRKPAEADPNPAHTLDWAGQHATAPLLEQIRERAEPLRHSLTASV
jgi:HD-like signal output (HDOD) protein